ncbi:Uma2 family endonuclease [Sorangium sp. So ce861]|uniref:Uma2 family endonuclease n=1 Tax=Sorangium sp. So ce861 TaxID=3133323 RepID=UPI003F5E536A
MGQRAEKQRRATYADLEAVPPNKMAELVRGTLHVFPRPAPRHAQAETELATELVGAFGRGRGGPGGWRILVEPELHFPDPEAPGEIDALVPDIAGWRRERMPELPKTAYFELAPDWICEVLSPSTEDYDRGEKMPIYAREGVRNAWLVDPIARSLEVYALSSGREWTSVATHRDAARVRVEPFDAIELDLSVVWAK